MVRVTPSDVNNELITMRATLFNYNSWDNEYLSSPIISRN